MYLNADIPPIKCYIRKEFLYDQQQHFGEHVEVIIFGVCGLQGQAPLFHCMSTFGAVWFRQPIHAFFWRTGAACAPLDELCLWNAFSNSIAVHEFRYLRNLRCAYFGKDRQFHPGVYMFTIDWSAQHGELCFAESPDEYKCHHVIKLDSGQFALQPNNRIKWFEPAFIVEPFPDEPDFKVCTNTWSVESTDKWRTDNTDHMFYDVSDISDTVSLEWSRHAFTQPDDGTPC